MTGFAPYRYRILALLSLASGLAAYAGRGIWVVDAFAANMAAGFMGALITVALIDHAAERREEENRSRMKRVAMKQLEAPLTRVAWLFADMLKSSMASSVARPKEYRELFAKPFIDNLEYIRLSAECGSLCEGDWASFASKTLKHESTLLSEFIGKYAEFVPVELTEMLEDLRTDQFVFFLENVPHVHEQLRACGESGYLTLAGLSYIRDPFFEKLLRLIEYYEAAADDEIAMSIPYTLDRSLPQASARFTDEEIAARGHIPSREEIFGSGV